MENKVYYLNNKNIYITSNEEIKVGDWVIEFQKGDDIGEVHFINSEYVIARDIQKKIILTTDELYIHNDLIPKEYNPFPQYIQKIDYEFLEWFVKNPSCKSVKVERGKLQIDDDGQEYGFPDMSKYKIIIPQEQPKQLTDLEIAIKLEEIEREEYQLNTCDIIFERAALIDLEENKQELHICKYCGAETTQPDDECYMLRLKQETLEEFAKRKYLSRLDNFEKVDFKDGVFEGAKWQAERMYSEEEVKDLILKFNNDKPGIYDASEWFEQYKKK
jgi:hypothetical protein